MRTLSTLPRNHWLFIPAATQHITLATPCREVCTEEYLDTEIEEFCREHAVREFFFKDQLEGIRNNLEAQVSAPTDRQLEEAIDYYWRRDAFLVVSK